MLDDSTRIKVRTNRERRAASQRCILTPHSGNCSPLRGKCSPPYSGNFGLDESVWICNKQCNKDETEKTND